MAGHGRVILGGLPCDWIDIIWVNTRFQGKLIFCPTSCLRWGCGCSLCKYFCWLLLLLLLQGLLGCLFHDIHPLNNLIDYRLGQVGL